MRFAATLSAVIALRMLGLFLILPVFMVLARDVPGFTPQAAGLAVGIYGLTQAILQQPFGWLSDRWGRRPVLLLGLALFAAGCSVYDEGLTDWESLDAGADARSAGVRDAGSPPPSGSGSPMGANGSDRGALKVKSY